MKMNELWHDMKNSVNWIYITLLLAIAFLACIRTVAVAQNSPDPEQNNIVFILDASGSMKGDAGGKSKMDAAKEVMTQLVGDLPQSLRAGLIAYGHRVKNDCKDVELLLPIEQVQKELFIQKIQELQPLGQTPISYSIRQAADVFKEQHGKKTIILISDGEETCKEDPCAVAADLKKAGIDFKIHVVGFGLDTAGAKKQLQCIADATGGIYTEAGNAEELQKKLTEVATAQDQGGETGKLISEILDMDGQPIRYSMYLYKPGTTETIDLELQDMDSVHEINVPPGVYDVEYTSIFSPTLWKRNVEIKAGQETRVIFERFGRIRVSIKDQNGENVRMGVEVHDASPEENDLIVDHGFKEVLDLPAGIYDVKFGQMGYDEIWQKDVVVKSGQETPLNVNASVSN